MKQNIAMENLNKAFELFEKYPQHGTFDADIPKEEELIRKVEATLDVSFTPSYYQFLKKYGCVDFFGDEYYGIWKKDADGNSGSEVIRMTLDYRNQYGLPYQYIIVGNSGYGPLDAIDTSKPDEHGECPVVMIDGPYKNPDTGEKKEWYEMEQMAPDFGTYLYNQSKAALQNSIDSGEVEA